MKDAGRRGRIYVAHDTKPRVDARPVLVTRRKRGSKVRPCLRCGRPRWSTSPNDRLHERCRAAAVENDGDRAGLVR